jgi:hypothetical protein
VASEPRTESKVFTFCSLVKPPVFCGSNPAASSSKQLTATPLINVTYRQHKYNARKTAYNGVLYDSMREAEYARGLDLRLRARGKDRVKSWRRQVPLKLSVNGTDIGKMVVDFELTYPDGSVELVEIKGMRTELYNWKLKHLRAQYPNLNYTIL